MSLASQFCVAQQLALNSSLGVMNSKVDEPGSGTIAAAVPRVKTDLDQKPLTGRWLELQTLSHSERYRNAFQVGGYHDFDNAQQRSLIEGKIKLDPAGHYAIGFRRLVWSIFQLGLRELYG